MGIIGCGNISRTYCKGLKKFPILELVGCADIDMERAVSLANEFEVPNIYTVEELLADKDIEIVINLTIPKVHAEISLAVLESGKHVYVEKPLAVTKEDGERVLELAKRKGLLVGSAPDTFLGGGLQTCRKIIDDGWIGIPVAATAFMMENGPESWHPDPDFLYQEGAGPMFDRGPYYLTGLIHLLGPIKRVTGSARITFPVRKITSEPKNGSMINVNAPTHIAGILDFENGVICTLITSFDIFGGTSDFPHIEIYGTEGSLRIPDPNTFGGPVYIKKNGAKEWSEMSLSHGFTEQGRGLGVADMAYSIQKGRKHRANGELAYHVLEAMEGFHEASKSGCHYIMQSTCERPEALPLHLFG